MRARSLILFLLCLGWVLTPCLSLATPDVPWAELKEKEGLWYRGGDPRPFTGKAYSRSKSGGREFTFAFKDGKPHGEWIIWHKNGQKRSLTNYAAGVVQGISASWYESGQLKSQGNYLTGKRHGLLTEWNESGRKVAESKYDRGQLVTRKEFKK